MHIMLCGYSQWESKIVTVMLTDFHKYSQAYYALRLLSMGIQNRYGYAHRYSQTFTDIHKHSNTYYALWLFSMGIHNRYGYADMVYHIKIYILTTIYIYTVSILLS
jgi:hypothetical protein